MAFAMMLSMEKKVVCVFALCVQVLESSTCPVALPEKIRRDKERYEGVETEVQAATSERSEAHDRFASWKYRKRLRRDQTWFCRWDFGGRGERVMC